MHASPASQPQDHDLAYIRTLAEDGRHAPLLGGRFLAWWGAITTLAYGSHYCVIKGFFGLPMNALTVLWLTFVVVGCAGHAILARTMPRDKPGMASAGNRVEAAVWMIGGWTLFAYFAAAAGRALFTGDFSIFSQSLPVVFAVYAIGQFTSGAIAGNSILKVAAMGALMMVALGVWFEDTAEIWAVAGIGAMLTVCIPGLFQILKEPKSIG